MKINDISCKCLILRIIRTNMHGNTNVFNFLATLGVALVMFLSCSSNKPELVPENHDMEKDTVIFSERITAGIMDNTEIDEASGMDMSNIHENMFWTHNDSGDKARLFLVNTRAQYVMSCTLQQGTNRDWEDIVVARDPKSGTSRIFIADIGDNNAVYDYGKIYIIDEPEVQSGTDITVSNVDQIIFRYEDGQRDAETLLVDPLTGHIYIVSKRETMVNLYQITYPYTFSDTTMAKKLISIPFTQIVGGDISADGSEIVLKNYNKVWYWQRKKGTTIAETLIKKPFETTYIMEPQGEAICWSFDAKSFYTLSEAGPFKIKPVLYRYDKK